MRHPPQEIAPAKTHLQDAVVRNQGQRAEGGVGKLGHVGRPFPAQPAVLHHETADFPPLLPDLALAADLLRGVGVEQPLLPLADDAVLLNAGREALILMAIALAFALVYLVIRGDWSLARIGNALQLDGVGVGAVRLFLAIGSTMRTPVSGVNATPDQLAAAARGSARARARGLGTVAVAAVAGLLIFGLGLLLQVWGSEFSELSRAGVLCAPCVLLSLGL
jgi:hypothetical protein